MKNCALVCRAWRPLAQRHLYSKMTLTGFEQQVPVLVLKQASHLLGYVRQLSITYAYVPEAGDGEMLHDENDEQGEKSMILVQLLPVVRAMKHVTSIDIGALDFRITPGPSVPTRTLSSLVSHMRECLPFAATIRSVTVSLTSPHLVAILGCLHAFPGLHTLRLGHAISLDRSNWVLDIADTPGDTVKQLTFSVHSAVHSSLAMIQSYTGVVAQLQVVDITISPIHQARDSEGPATESFLVLCGRALERLHVRCDTDINYTINRYSAYLPLLRKAPQLTVQPNADSLDFSPLLRLRILVLHISSLWELAFIRNILETLRQSPSRETIEEIRVQATEGIKRAVDFKAFGACDDWERVDAAIAGLATRPRFSCASFLVPCVFLH
jgi:hypothetical protein